MFTMCMNILECTEGAVLRRHTTLSRFFSVPDLHVKKTYQPKSSARVLREFATNRRDGKGKGSIKERATEKKGRETTAKTSRLNTCVYMYVWYMYVHTYTTISLLVYQK